MVAGNLQPKKTVLDDEAASVHICQLLSFYNTG